MAVIIQHVEMQSVSFWTVKYQTLYHGEYWYWPNAGIKVNWQRERSRCNNWFEVKVFESYCPTSEKSQLIDGSYSKIIQFSRHSFIQVFVYFSCSPSSWIFCYGLVSTIKKRWRFNRKRPSLCFLDVTTVIKFNLWRELAKIETPRMKYRRMRGDMIMVYKVLNGYDHCWNIYLQLIIIL